MCRADHCVDRPSRPACCEERGADRGQESAQSSRSGFAKVVLDVTELGERTRHCKTRPGSALKQLEMDIVGGDVAAPSRHVSHFEKHGHPDARSSSCTQMSLSDLSTRGFSVATLSATGRLSFIQNGLSRLGIHHVSAQTRLLGGDGADGGIWYDPHLDSHSPDALGRAIVGLFTKNAALVWWERGEWQGTHMLRANLAKC